MLTQLAYNSTSPVVRPYTLFQRPPKLISNWYTMLLYKENVFEFNSKFVGIIVLIKVLLTPTFCQYTCMNHSNILRSVIR